jgi:hypothetical protein
MLSVLLFYSTYFGGLLQSLRSAPVYAFLTYQAVYFFNPPNRWWDYLVLDISYSFYTVILMIVLYLANKKELDKNKLFDVPHFKYIYILLVLNFIAYFYAVNLDSHYKMLDAYSKLVITMTIAYKLINSIKFLDYSLIAYTYGASYLSFIAFQTGRNSGDRIEGIGTVDSPDANGTACALAPAVVICLYYVWVAKSWRQRAVFLIATAIIANALVLINSRGAFLGAFIGIVYFMGALFFTKIQSRGQKMKIIGLGLLGLIAAYNLMDDSFKERMLTITNETEVQEDKETGATRTIFWKAAIDMSYDYPFGQGVKGFNYYGPVYIPYDVVISSNARADRAAVRRKSVHSSWFEALTEVGYPGLFVFILLLIVSFKTTNKIKRYLRYLGVRAIDHYYKILMIQASLLSFMVAASFMNRFRAEIFYWCILFTACAYNLYIVKRTNKPSYQKFIKSRNSP